MQNELVERRGKWMIILKEFDLESQLMNFLRGKGLTKMIVDNEIGNDKKTRFDDEINIDDQQKITMSQVDIDEGVIIDVWYQDIVYYLL